MFSFSFASKMLNTIMGTEEQQQQQGVGGQPQQSMGGPPGQPGMRPMGGGGFPQARPPAPGPLAGSPRPGFPGPPTFSGPRPSPGVRAGPPSFGGPPRPTMGGVGTPHRFNGPQPPPQQQQPQQQQMLQQQHPQQQQQHPQQQQFQQQPPPPGQMVRGMSPMPGARAPSPGPQQRQRGPGPGPGMGGPMSMGGPSPNQPFPQRVAGVAGPSSAAAPVPDVDLSHLSAEERAMIENVMAKAQQLEQGPPPPAPGLSSTQPGSQQRMLRPEAQHPGMDPSGGVRMCPLCRQRDVSGKMDGIPGQECTECRLLVCNRCGGMSPHPETKRPEWVCGNCINKRRQRMGQFPPGSVPGHQQPQQMGQPRVGSPYGSQLQQSMQPMDPEGSRRGSGGAMQGNLAQQSEREFDQIESKEVVGTWGSEIKHRRRPSFEEIFSPEKTVQSEELLHESPVDVDFNYPSDPSFPEYSQCMSTHHTASASQAKPSFVTNNKLHSRSLSIDMAEKQESVLSPPQTGFDYFSEEQYEETPMFHDEPMSSSQLTTDFPPAPPKDEKASALMEELSKLQSAVDSTLKRTQRQKLETDERDHLFHPIRSRSPSPSPSPRGSPIRSRESMSPMMSPPKQTLSPDRESPESPDIPGPRKAIVMKEHDLDDYKSSSEEEVESDDSDEARKGVAGGEVYYDHSPGEVYTIPEEEDEGGSPLGGDLVSSLKRQGVGFPPGVPGSDMGTPRRRFPEQEMPMGSLDPRQQLRPQLRPQRSLDNRLPSTQPDMSTAQSMDQRGNIYATNNNMNTQLGTLDNQGMHQDIVSTSLGLPTSSQHSAMISVAPTSTSLCQQQPDPFQQQGAFGSSMMGIGQETQQHIDMNRSMQQSQQLGQLPGESLGVGVSVSDWNNSGGQNPLLGPSNVPISSTDPSTANIVQPYQQQPPSTYSQVTTSAGQSQMTSQPFQQSAQIFQQQQAAPQTQLQPSQTGFSQQPTPLTPQQMHSPQTQQTFQNKNLLGQPMQNQTQPHQLDNQFQNQAVQNLEMSPLQPTGGALQGQQLQQLQAQQAQAQQLAQQQSWHQQTDPLQPQPQQQSIYDQSGRLVSGPTPMPAFSQSETQQAQTGLHPQDQYQQSMQMMQQQYQQPGAPGTQQLGTATNLLGQGNIPQVNTSQAGPGAKSIGGLLADFSRALGLGSTSPRPSPSEDKSLAFPMSGGAGGMPGQIQPISPYDPYQPHQLPTSIPQSISHQHSAFASIHDSYPRQNQQLSYMAHSPQPGLQAQLVSQFATANQVQQSQQYGSSASPQAYQALTQAGLQQQAGGVGVGVIGALSPAQAHMYQQQMAMQHQQQHLKKRSRGGHISTAGELRRDGQPSTVLIGGQGLAVTPSGMTIGALTPAVVTSLGTFIGGGPTILGTQLLQQPMAVTPLGTPIGTPVGTPRSGREPPGAGDSSDTMSETDSQKSLRMRRKLPCLPPDQEAAPLPSTKKRERHRSQEHFRSLSPLRMPMSDGMLPGRQYPFSSLCLSRPSASESNLRKISMSASDPVPRPGSALGLLQASSVVSSMGGKPDVAYPLSSSLFSTSSTFPGMRTSIGYPTDLTTTTSVLAGLYPSHKTSQDSWNANLAELAACLPPDLRHLLNKGTGSLDHDLSGIGLSGIVSGLGDSSLNSGTQLPSYIRTLREQLQEERRQLLSEERRRLEQLRERDRELGARLDAVTSRAGEGMRSRADLGISRSAGASPLLSRKLKSHRRQLSDPKLSLPFSPIQEDGDSELQDFDRVSANLLRPTYKSYEYESLEDNALVHHTSTFQPQFDWDHSQSYLASSWAAAGGVLRETAINSMGTDKEHLTSGIPSHYLSRRNSEGEPTLSTSRLSSSHRDRRHQFRKHRKSRSWHPSPYVSEEEEEEEEDLLSREEKKARIKAEIARRRQQMQDRSGMHSEFSRMRDGSDQERHSVLKSVDQLIRDQYGRYEPSSSYGKFLMSSGGLGRYQHLHHGPSGNVISPCASEEDRSIERIASTFRSDELYYERLGEMSPMATDSESMGSELGAPAAMPILPDMPTRSRRLLEDLGSAPIGLNEGSLGGSASGQSMKGRRRQTPPKMESVAVSRRSSTKELVSESSRNNKERDAPMSRRYSEDNRVVSGAKRKPLKGKNIPQGNVPERSERQSRKTQTTNSQRSQKNYKFPIKRYMFTRDPKDQSIDSNGIGLKIVGGKEIPDSNGHLAAYIAKIYPDKLETSGHNIHEGDVVLEWNGVSLDNKTFEEVTTVVQGTSNDKIELILRSDYNILTGKSTQSPEQGEEGNSRIESKPSSRQQEYDDEDGRRRSSDFYQSSFYAIGSENYQDLPKDFSHYGMTDADRAVYEINSKSIGYGGRMVKSPSSSTEATNTSAATSSIHQSGTIFDDPSKFSHHLVLPTETDLRKRSTSSLPPSLTEAHLSEQNFSARSGRKGSENISVKSMGMGSPENERKFSSAARGKKGSYGQIQLQICHDPRANILYVTVLRARLPKQKNEDGTDHVQVDPYVTVYLLPDKVVENQRRTRHVSMTCSPQWNQTMVYPNVSVADLKEKYLEVSAKNYNPTGDEDPLFGRVILYLSDEGILDEQPHSYSLRLEEKAYRRRSSQSHLKSQQAPKSTSAKWDHTSRRHSSRCSHPGDCEVSPTLSPGTPVTGRWFSSGITFFSSRALHTSTSLLPTDCHGALCSIF